jgi:signal transduction histidine kinase
VGERDQRRSPGRHRVSARPSAAAGAVSTQADVTALRELQEQHEDFVRTVSHDLRQPLAVIQGHAEILHGALVKEGGDARRQRSLEAVVASAKRMNAMIGDLVDSARLEAGQVALNPGPVDLFALLAPAVQRPGIPGQVSRVRLDLPDPAPRVLADPERLNG